MVIISIEASLTVHMDEASWKALVKENGAEIDPEQAALDWIAEGCSGVDFDGPPECSRAFIADACDPSLV